MKRVIPLLLAASLAGCATPKTVRSLAEITGPFVAETQGSAAAVQKRFTQQTALVEGRIARWNDNAAAARATAETPIALWTIDGAAGGSRAPEAKAKLLFLEQVRAPRPAASAPAATAPEPAAVVGSAKLIMLLDGIAQGKLMTPETVGAWVQATESALAGLRKDAAADAAKDAATDAKEK